MIETLRFLKSLLLLTPVAAACASTASGTDHETHWLSCSTTSDCSAGYACRSGKCEPLALAADAGSNASKPDATNSQSDGAGRTSPSVEAATPSIRNPTGNCVAPDDGGRAGYHDPGSSVWLPDCNNPLNREYWRVFATSESSAYVLPRPDGAPQIMDACLSLAEPMSTLVQKYKLCQPAPDQQTTDIINNMLPADALTITHYMHTELVFESFSEQPFFTPFAIPSDVIDACKLHPDRSSAALKQDCDLEQHYVDTGFEPLPQFMASGPEMAALLNELYGIGHCVAPDAVPRWLCLGCGPTDACSGHEVRCTRTCTTQSDCVGVAAGGNCALTPTGSGFCSPTPGCP